MPNTQWDEILISGHFKVDITGCASSADCVSAEVDDIEIEMQDCTQSNNQNWRAFTSAQPVYGAASFTFRVANAALNKDLGQWVDETRQGKNIRKNITITIFKKDKKTAARTYNLVNCFPVSFSGGDFTVDGEANLAKLKVKPEIIEIG